MKKEFGKFELYNTAIYANTISTVRGVVVCGLTSLPFLHVLLLQYQVKNLEVTNADNDIAFTSNL